MLHSASLTDPTLAFSPYNPFSAPPLSHPSESILTPNGLHPCSPTASSAAAVAALTAAVAVSAGIPPNVKDSRWLTLEVCRQYQRNQCSRDENECKFAHPPTHVDVQNGRVVCCYDSIKGKCQRRDPPCKYLHPPQHLREQLMQNGRNNMIIRNMQLQLFQQQLLAQSSGIFPFGTPPCNSGTANSLNGTSSPNSILYAGPGPLALGNPNIPTSFLSMGFAPYLTAALTNSNLNGAPLIPELIGPDVNGTTCKQRSDSKHTSFYLQRSNGNSRNEGKQDGSVDAPQCVMVVNGSNTNVEPMKELNGGSPHTVPVTIRSTMAPATLYAIQAPSGPSQCAASMLNHAPPPPPLTAASLATVVNGNGALAPGHFPALPDHSAYFQPTYHIEIPPYPY